MDDMIMKVIELIIMILIAVVGRYVIPYIKAKTGEQKFELILAWATTFVTAAEKMIMGEKTGDEKRELVTRWLVEKAKELKINLTDEQIRTIIESALAQAKHEGIISVAK